MPVLAGACLLAGFATTVPLIVFAIFLLRLFGQGMMTHTALTATGRWFSAERGRAISLVVLGHQGGEATIPLAFVLVTIVYSYTVGWVLAALALLFVGLPIAFLCYRQPRIPHGQQLEEGEFRKDSQLDSSRGRTRSDFLVVADRHAGATIYRYDNLLPPGLHGDPAWLAATPVRNVAAGDGVRHREFCVVVRRSD